MKEKHNKKFPNGLIEKEDKFKNEMSKNRKKKINKTKTKKY